MRYKLLSHFSDETNLYSTLLAMNMTAREFVMQNVKKEDSFGVEGYFLAKTLTSFDKPLVTKIHSGKKKTFVDDEVKLHNFVPGAKYEVMPTWNQPRQKSNLCKDKRHTIATDIERECKRETRPEAPTYSP